MKRNQKDFFKTWCFYPSEQTKPACSTLELNSPWTAAPPAPASSSRTQIWQNNLVSVPTVKKLHNLSALVGLGEKVHASASRRINTKSLDIRKASLMVFQITESFTKSPLRSSRPIITPALPRLALCSVCKCQIYMLFDHFQGQWFHHFLGQLVPRAWQPLPGRNFS